MNSPPVLLLDFRSNKKFHRFDPESGRAEPVRDSDGRVTIDDVAGFFDRRLVGLLRPRDVNVAIIFRDDFVEVWIDGKKIQFDENDGDVCFVRSGVAPFVHEFVARAVDEDAFVKLESADISTPGRPRRT